MAGMASNRIEDINALGDGVAPPTPTDEVVVEVNRCGCTDFFTRIFAIIMAVLFVIFWLVGILVFGRSDRTASSIFILLGFAAVIASIVGCTLLCCACCKPPKGADE